MRFSICIITNAGLDSQSHRRDYIRRLISSLPNAGFSPENSEVIVSGALFDGLTCTRAIPLAELAESGNVSALRNLAIKEAQGDWIVQCDDDVIFTPGYVLSISEMLTENTDILCARLLNPNGTRYWDWAAFIPGKGQTLLPYNVKHEYVYATGGHAIYRRYIFDKVRWNECIRHGGNEEFEFAANARRSGLKYAFCEDATVFLQYHHCDALAACGGGSKIPADKHCRDFENLMYTLNGEGHGNGVIASTDTDNLRKRLGHKLATVTTPPQSIDVSIVTCCNRYLQRFRIFAQSLCRQEYDLSKIEVLVANPNSPDGLSTYLNTLKIAQLVPKFVDVLMEQVHWRNRGAMIQEAFLQSRGNIVIGMDCDLILPRDFLRRVVDAVQQNPQRVVGVYRNFLTAETTASILTGALDPFQNFESLKSEDQEESLGFRGVLGYCQAVTRDAWNRTGYPIEFDEIAKSDVAFNERLATIGVAPLFLRDVTALHLNHERNWMGTDDFL